MFPVVATPVVATPVTRALFEFLHVTRFSTSLRSLGSLGSQACQEQQARVIADVRSLVAWHRGLYMVMEGGRGGGETPTDMKRAIQNVRERLVAPTPLCERLVACLDEMDACADAGAEPGGPRGVGCGRQRAGGGDGGGDGGPCGEAGMREAARCLRSVPEDVVRLRLLVDEASEALAEAMGEGEGEAMAEDLAGLAGYAASLDAVADGVAVLEVVAKNVCVVEGGLTIEDVQAVEGVVALL